MTNETTQMTARFRLADLLEAAGPTMNQSELARRSGVSIVTINSMANNRTKQVRLDTLERIAVALGVEPGELIEREPKKRKVK
jgi:DNA-binding Xre family transcriptional regulator